MSIIHDALKKAAAENEASHPKTFFVKRPSGFPLSRKTAFLIFSFGFVLLFFFLISARNFWPVFLTSFSQQRSPSEPPPQTAPPISAVSPAPDRPSSSDQVKREPASGTELKRKEGEGALEEGLDFYSLGKVDLAHQSFTKAAALLPLSAVVHNNLGMTLRQQGKMEEAIDHYREAIDLESDYAEAYNNLGMAYDQLGSIDQAAVHYKKAIQLKPSVPVFHLNYATWLERKGDFVKARQEYQLYLDLEWNALHKGTLTSRQKESIALVTARLRTLKGL